METRKNTRLESFVVQSPILIVSISHSREPIAKALS